MKIIFTILVLLISFSCSQECQEPTNVWFKLSNDTSSKDYGETILIDMSKGFADTDGVNIYLLLRLKDSEEGVIVSFPIGYWEIEQPSEFIKELEKEFKNLEEYFRQKESQSTEIKRQHKIKVGD